MPEMRSRWAAIIVACMGTTTGLLPRAQAQIQWNFTSDSDGWVVADLQCGVAYRDALAAYPATWHATGGDSVGYISGTDQTSNCFFFQAPAEQLGNLSSYEGGRIQFSLKSSHNTWLQDNVVVLVGANSTVLVAEITPLPATSWTRYEVLLLADSFRYNTKAGAVCSETGFQAVLANVIAMRIPAEFGSSVQETTSLDRVRLVTPWGCTECPTDYDEDCDVDGNDFEVFLACVSGPGVLQADASCRQKADLDNDGDVDQNDFGVFQRCFTGPQP
ncbi:MAG: hypothetical protein KA354_13175 [Phycisphaerae bacterium]|nr:hypothetical protein [Phycisphaerae bacterium]